MGTEIYGFGAADAARLLTLANNGRPGAGISLPGVTQSAGAWIVEATSTITAASYSTSITPGSGTVKLKTIGSGNVVDHLSNSNIVSRTPYSLMPHALPTGALCTMSRMLDGNLWLTQWLDQPSLLCRFTCDTTFTTGSISVEGTITDYIGLGRDHTTMTDPPTFYNLHIAGTTYLFSSTTADKAGLAYWRGVAGEWQIIQMGCP